MNRRQLHGCARLVTKQALKRFKDISEEFFVSIKRDYVDFTEEDILFEFQLVDMNTCESIGNSVYLSVDDMYSKREYYLSVYGEDCDQITFKLDGSEPMKHIVRDALSYIQETLTHNN